MRTRTKIIIGSVALAAALAAGGTAMADRGADHEQPITGEDLDRASEAALEHTGEGRVTDTEVGDEESHYEVEVTLDDGTQVDVQLDADFEVVATESDGTGDEDD
jgi:uncharacterized membrane protein YkoI